MSKLSAAALTAALATPGFGLLAINKPKPAAPQTTLLNLSCMTALAAVDQADLAGVFTFIAEKDSAAAFAELLVRNKASLKRYRNKLDGDVKAVRGVSVWDHEVLMRLLEIYASVQAEMLDKPSSSLLGRFNELSLAPTLTLEEMTARRGGRR